jgi:TolB protein
MDSDGRTDLSRTIAGVAGALILLAAGSTQSNVAAVATFELQSAIAFTSTRDALPGTPTPIVTAAEIYLMNSDGSHPRRLTNNDSGDAFPVLSPDGKTIVFDSNRNRVDGEPLNTSDLFVMNTDGSEQALLTRGSSATWSPDNKKVAFHASASGTGTPIRPDPGSATTDSDIFVANVDDIVAGLEPPIDITNSVGIIDEDVDWAPDGTRIAYTRHSDTDDPQFSNTAEIYLLNADGNGTPERLTNNAEEERGSAWSPDGEKIVFACRVGGGRADFEICVINADGSGTVQQLTNNAIADLTPTWSPDGHQVLFHRRVIVAGVITQQLFVLDAPANNADCDRQVAPCDLPATELTFPPGFNNLASWGELRVKVSP